MSATDETTRTRPDPANPTTATVARPLIEPDPAAVEAFAFEAVERLAAAWTVVATHIGDRLGLYAALAEGAGTADEIAARTSTNVRLTREWLDGQVAAGIVVLDGDRYSLPPERAAVLAFEHSPAFIGAASGVLAAVFQAEDAIAAAFRGDGGLAWGDQAPCLSHAVDRFFRTGYRASLVDDWIGALDGIGARLEAGGRIADVGCGRGSALILMARAFPNSVCVGVDSDERSIARASEAVSAEGLGTTVRLERATADRFGGGPFDLICFLDALHDMGDPEGVLRHVRSQLADDGAVLLVEPAARETIDERIGDLAAQLYYPGSAFLCTPNALSQGDVALGNQVPEATWRDLFARTGFTTFRLAASTPFNRVFEAR
jgi:SAM-dependent methyltransferase